MHGCQSSRFYVICEYFYTTPSFRSKLKEMSNCPHGNQVTIRSFPIPHCRTYCCCIGNLETIREISKLNEMSNCPHERQVTIRSIQKPHCRTCCCSYDLETEYKMAASCSVRLSPRTVNSVIRDCICECHRQEDICPHCLHPKVFVNLHSHDECPRWLTYSDNTYKTLEHWFTLFDLNEDGFLDFTEFKYLLEFFGTHLENTQIRRLLNRADSNMDGRLSFSDFLWMWHEAAVHEREFLAATEAHDLLHIINKYDLFPQEARKRVVQRKEKVKPETNDFHAQNEPNCSCGTEEVDLFIDSDELGAVMDYERTPPNQSSTDNDTTQKLSENVNPPIEEDQVENAEE